MLRRLTVRSAGVILAVIAIAACSSPGNSTISVGPNFASQTLYATNSTQNAISIYASGSKTGSGPAYQIGGSNTTLAGPQYITFDAAGDIITTNWNASLGTGLILVMKSSATGNVIPINSLSTGIIHPRGISDFQGYSPLLGGNGDILAVALVDPTQPLSFQGTIEFYSASVLGGYIERVAGPATGLNVPSGIVVDKNQNIFVTNLQGASVEEFNFVSPSPTPSPTATPTATPSPSPTPTGATPSPTPTVSPTATPVNLPPKALLQGAATGINQPTGIALDASGNIYVSDQASTICAPAVAKCPAVLIFPPGSNGAVVPRYIAGAATQLFAPTDVKVDTNGNIYVADSTATGAGVVYIFASTATGNVAPTATFTSPGSVIGLGLLP